MSSSVVVTGANRGIGLATVLELAGAGYDVIGTTRSAGKARAMLEAAEAKGLSVRAVLLDVADDASTERGFAEIAALTGGGPWAVVNNAGFAQAGAIEDVDAAAIRAQLEVALVAPLASPLPLSRYPVGVDAVAGVAADMLVPTAIGDLVKEVVAGIRRPLPRR